MKKIIQIVEVSTGKIHTEIKTLEQLLSFLKENNFGEDFQRKDAVEKLLSSNKESTLSMNCLWRAKLITKKKMNEKQRNRFSSMVNKVSEPPHGGLATKLSDRFQDQPWYIRLWRYRWYLRVPYHTIRIYFRNKKMHENDLYFAFSLAMGEAHYRMNWLYSMEEAMKVLENKRKK